MIETAVRYHFKSAHSWWEFNHLRPKQIEYRYNIALGKTGLKYLRGYEGLGIGVAVLSAGMEAINYHSYYVHPDRLGSYTHITDSSKQVIRSLP